MTATGTVFRVPAGRRHPAPLPLAGDDTAARRLVVTVMLLAIALDQSIAPALAPAIGMVAGVFHLSAHAAAWLDMSFNIGYFCAIVVSLWAIERFGKREYLGWSLCAFAIASLACACAPNAGVLTVARVLQGASAGGFFTSGLLTIVATAPKSDLPLAMILFSAVSLLAPTLAPLYAGSLLEHGAWRLVFAGLMLPALAGAFVTFRWMADVTEARMVRFDATNFAALVIALASFQFLVTQGAGRRWFLAPTVALAAVATIGAGAVYALRELRTSPAPFLDLRVLTLSFIARGLLAGVLLGVLLEGTAIEAQFVREAFGLGPAATGALVAIRCVGIAIGVAGATLLNARGISNRALMVFGLGLTAAAYAVQGAIILSHAALDAHVIAGIVQGFALPFVLGPLGSALFGAIDRNEFASLVVLFKLAVLLGAGVGLAVATTILSQGTATGTGSIGTYAGIWFGAAALSLVTAAIAATLREPASATPA